jgi:hypothetical protein
MSESWTVLRLLTWTTDFLKQRGSESPRLEAEVLLAAAKSCDRIMLYTAFDEVVSDEIRTRFRELVKRRADGAPVAYLVGQREFYSLRLKVTPDVLIPRPEAEPSPSPSPSMPQPAASGRSIRVRRLWRLLARMRLRITWRTGLNSSQEICWQRFHAKPSSP